MVVVLFSASEIHNCASQISICNKKLLHLDLIQNLTICMYVHIKLKSATLRPIMNGPVLRDQPFHKCASNRNSTRNPKNARRLDLSLKMV